MDDDAGNCDKMFSFDLKDTRVLLIWHRIASGNTERMRV